MNIGIGIPNAIPNTPGSVWTQWARRAEERGFSSLSTIGRTVFDCHEELIALTACAAVTEKIRLATTVMIGPTRETTLLAKQAASLQSLSGHRLTLGLGIGWRPTDFEATGTTDVWSRRGKALETQIADLKSVWKDPAIGPKLTQDPEILIGGAAPAALRRAGRLADAFMAGPFPKERVQECFEAVEEAAEGRRVRRVGSRYFALGSEGEDMKSNVRAYYQAGGEELVETMISRVLTTPEQVLEAVEDMRELGCDELCIWPQLNHWDQVDLLADIVFALR